MASRRGHAIIIGERDGRDFKSSCHASHFTENKLFTASLLLDSKKCWRVRCGLWLAPPQPGHASAIYAAKPPRPGHVYRRTLALAMAKA